MTIHEIKSLINRTEGSNIGTLLIQNQKTTLPGTTTEVASDWFSHWEAPSRIRVALHKDVLLKLKADTNRCDLIAKKQSVAAEGDRAAYIRYIVAIPREVDLAI